ncbi:MAG TPA: hypothetical protein VGC11_09270 [Acidimicrobiia bacterium]|jgi:hypothetical protein
MASRLTVMNPMGYPPKVTARGLAPSLATLDGKTVFLVDVGFENSDNFMQQLQAWFAQHQPRVTTRLAKWKNQHLPDPELSDQIRTEGDAAILGVGL